MSASRKSVAGTILPTVRLDRTSRTDGPQRRTFHSVVASSSDLVSVPTKRKPNLAMLTAEPTDN
eukprot:8773906-Alexandrium_andersonii.AAC.1